MIALNLNPPVDDSDIVFLPGQLIQHGRYGYRGVIVECDFSCQAEMDWYLSNQTQPDRTQPWYHVLVDRSTSITYVAQENLLPDDSGEPIRHPLVSVFFSEFDDGQYTRNERPWPTSV